MSPTYFSKQIEGLVEVNICDRQHIHLLLLYYADFASATAEKRYQRHSIIRCVHPRVSLCSTAGNDTKTL